MNEQIQIDQLAPGAGSKASSIEIHLSIVDHVLMPCVHCGLDCHHLHSARCINTIETRVSLEA